MKYTNEFNLTIVIFSLIVIFGVLNPIFLTLSNLFNLIDQIAIIGIIAIGLTLVIITGGIDLSVGSIVAFSGIVLAKCLANDVLFPISIIVCLFTGIGIGLINGFIITYGKVPAFIATLGLMSIARGASLYITDGRAISNLSNNLFFLISSSFLGISFSIYVFIILTVFFGLFLKYTFWGKYIYAIGGNEKAAWLSGINTRRYKIFVYATSGLMCAIASLILVGKLNSAQPQAGNMYELNAIATVVIGGSSLTGGKGNITGTFMGVLILGLLQNGFSILNVSSYYQQILIGIIVILAILIDNKPFKNIKT